MNSRKLMLDTLEMRNHSRAPRDLWTLPWATKRYKKELDELNTTFPMDYFCTPSYKQAPGVAKGDPYLPGISLDNWGCEFVNLMEGVYGEVKNPQIVSEDWDGIDQVRIPYDQLTINIEKINEYIKSTPDQFHAGGCCPRPFEQLQFIRGTEDLYMDLMDPPPQMLKFMERMHAFYCEELEIWGKTDVDCLNFMDDWGSQRALLISPRVWRAIFKPMYKDYIDIAHRAGKKIFMHSDGYTLDILPDLIELGLDAINTQIFCMGVDQLAPFKGKITFWGEIDRQVLLPFGSPQEVENAVVQVKETLWDNGGCIAQCEFGVGAKPENVRKVYETWDRLTNPSFKE